jgi:hypothetical protein
MGRIASAGKALEEPAEEALTSPTTAKGGGL